MKKSKFRISFSLDGEDRLGTVIALLAREVTDLEIREVGEPGRNSIVGLAKKSHGTMTAEKRKEWAMGYLPIVKEALGKDAVHLDTVSGRISAASKGKLQPQTVASLLSALHQAGVVNRVGRGVYRMMG